MNQIIKLTVGCLLALGMTVGASGNRTPPDVLKAHADIAGVPGSGISGVITFTQAPEDKNLPVPTVDVEARVEGLTPGQHGMHIHEIGMCTNTIRPDGSIFIFGGAGGHFDPGPFGNSGVDINHPFHMGDLPNLVANEAGVGHLRATVSRITLSDGPLSVFDANGSAIIVHLNPDQGITGVTGASGGARIACGVIVRDN